MARRKPRKARPKEKNVPKGYDSLWEYSLHQTILKKWGMRGNTVDYIIKKTYEPDFIKKINNKIILLESKGRFWDHAEYSKYIWIRESLSEFIELVFLFQNPTAPMPGAKKRKNGTKRSHSEWAETNNFRWYSEKTLPKEWRNNV